jgi:magnesium-transporting ATPase (P-type)
VGDVIIIEAGMKVPADCLLFEGMDVLIDEVTYNDGRDKMVKKSVSTGKNHRDNPDPFLLSQSLVISGSGRAIVCAVGKHS